MKRLSFFTAFLSSLVFAWPSSIILESEFRNRMDQEVLPLWNSVETKTFIAKEGLRLPYKHFKVNEERGAIVIVPGHKADKFEYREVIYTFVQEGYSVYVYDHRGQGHAPRLASNPQIAHVERFDDYIEDLHTFVSEIVLLERHPRLFLFGSSMGGLIATHYISAHPGLFHGSINIAPAFGIKLNGIPRPIAKSILQINIWRGLGKEYAPSKKDTSVEELKLSSTFNSMTRWNEELKEKTLDAALLMGGPSNQMLLGMLKSADRVPSVIPRITTPTLNYSAGNDETTYPESTHLFAKDSPTAFGIHFPSSFHCMLLEADTIRMPLMTGILRFLIHPERLERKRHAIKVFNLLEKDAQRYFKLSQNPFFIYTVSEMKRLKGLNEEEKLLLKHREEQAKEISNKGLTADEATTLDFLNAERASEIKKLYTVGGF